MGSASKIRLGVSIIYVIGLLGCSSALRWMPETHTVAAGDTVYSIAWQYGLDQRDLAAWNQLDKNGLIHPGRVCAYLRRPVPNLRGRNQIHKALHPPVRHRSEPRLRSRRLARLSPLDPGNGRRPAR